MRDQLGRDINYMRLSLTDRCNLRCRYCMPPEGVELVAHQEILTYEELLRIAHAAVSLGITRFKVTGGEPLVRRDCPAFVAALKQLPGIEQVTLTTNGQLLPQFLDALVAAGIDGINISLDTLDNAQYQAITRSTGTASQVLQAVRQCSQVLPTKINALLLAETHSQLLPLAKLAQMLPVDVRFIETMPIGTGARETQERRSALETLRSLWPDLHPTQERRGNGPAVYFHAQGLRGRIGLIEPLRHRFCSQCNRLRLTSTGMLLPCLYETQGCNLRPLLTNEAALRQAMEETVLKKPAGHHFHPGVPVPGQRFMNQIGG